MPKTGFPVFAKFSIQVHWKNWKAACLSRRTFLHPSCLRYSAFNEYSFYATVEIGMLVFIVFVPLFNCTFLSSFSRYWKLHNFHWVIFVCVHVSLQCSTCRKQKISSWQANICSHVHKVQTATAFLPEIWKVTGFVLKQQTPSKFPFGIVACMHAGIWHFLVVFFFL